MILSQLGKSCRPGEQICLELPAGRVNLSNSDKTWRPRKRICPNLTNVVSRESKFIQIWPMLPNGRTNLITLSYWQAASANLSYLVSQEYAFVVFCKYGRRIKFILFARQRNCCFVTVQATNLSYFVSLDDALVAGALLLLGKTLFQSTQTLSKPPQHFHHSRQRICLILWVCTTK